MNHWAFHAAWKCQQTPAKRRLVARKTGRAKSFARFWLQLLLFLGCAGNKKQIPDTQRSRERREEKKKKKCSGGFNECTDEAAACSTHFWRWCQRESLSKREPVFSLLWEEPQNHRWLKIAPVIFLRVCLHSVSPSLLPSPIWACACLHAHTGFTTWAVLSRPEISFVVRSVLVKMQV